MRLGSPTDVGSDDKLVDKVTDVVDIDARTLVAAVIAAEAAGGLDRVRRTRLVKVLVRIRDRIGFMLCGI